MDNSISFKGYTSRQIITTVKKTTTVGEDNKILRKLLKSKNEDFITYMPKNDEGVFNLGKRDGQELTLAPDSISIKRSNMPRLDRVTHDEWSTSASIKNESTVKLIKDVYDHLLKVVERQMPKN